MHSVTHRALRFLIAACTGCAVMVSGFFGWYLQPLISADIEYERLRAFSKPMDPHAIDNRPDSRESGNDAEDTGAPPRPSAELLENRRHIDWNALSTINKDVIGWIYVPNTPIDYPIVQAPVNDSEKYLRTTFEGSVAYPNNQGTIYLDSDNADDGLSSSAPVIYGHYQLNGSMLSSFSKNDSVDELSRHDQVFLYTPTTMFHVELFAGNIVDASTEKIKTSFTSRQELASWIREKLDESEAVLYRPPSIDQLFTFVTCSYSRWKDQRTLTYGMVIESASAEAVEHYSADEPASVD